MNGPQSSGRRLMAFVPIVFVVTVSFLAGALATLAYQHTLPEPKFEHEGDSKGFYVRPKEGRFLKLAQKAGTDKVNLEAAYHDIFERRRGHPKLRKMMEIGLGCDMVYGPGKSAVLWRSYFPDAEVWFAEYDAKCVAAHQDKLLALNVKAVTGDQADPSTVRGWVKQTGGDFDLIVDDGGHSNNQQYVAFIMLFQHALKPGGVYVIEDLQVSRLDVFQRGQENSKVVMIDAIKDWIEALLTFPTQDHKQKEDIAYTMKHKMPPGIKSIRCSMIACTFTKCFPDDPQCHFGHYADYNLPSFGMA